MTDVHQRLHNGLPEHLGERVRIHARGEPRDGQFILYWLRTAVRADENPALDVALSLGRQLRLPVLVYHALSQHYRYASDRHHTFMLQGARDLQSQLRTHNIDYAFHLATPNDSNEHLVTLANQSAVVVTEEMPVDPPRRFLNALVRKTNATILCVDTACVIPMQLIDRPYTRAFKFRDATEELYAQRLSRPWPALETSERGGFSETSQLDLPFEPVDLQTADIRKLVAQCAIDHSVGPVIDTPGGSTAGYQRWNQFKENRLNRYAKGRNDPLTDGVSRMSAYLHYGMVSPLRIAREAAAINNAGAEKYLDELLIWRELAYGFCFYNKDHDQWTAIPDWARATLTEHASDVRTGAYSWEQLARGQTEDALWNAAQKSLLMQGELHNNVRMTWGKAILNWQQSPQQALRTIIDLNHRYALDGRDPASYGGILWCLGQFDRPFKPAQKIIGTVRPRPTSQHANRIDLKTYTAKVTKPRFANVNVAVIGAGMSGLIAARTLQDHGVTVTVFEKSSGRGGRMSTRRSHRGSFDHGAQYFTARDDRFLRYVQSWTEQGLVAKWPDGDRGSAQKIVVLSNGVIQSESNSQERFVGVPTMNAIGKSLAKGLNIQQPVHVASAVKSTGIQNARQVALTDRDQQSLGEFDHLIVTSPAPQAAEILASFPAVADKISQVQMNPCWATMVEFEHPVTDQWAGAFLHDSFLSWAARNSTKPGRDRSVEQVVIHANPNWTKEHLQDDANEVAEQMLAEFFRVSGIAAQVATDQKPHLWRYAIPLQRQQAEGCFCDDAATVIAGGDWAYGSRVEGAFLSGMAMAGRVLGMLKRIPLAEPCQQSLLF